MHVPTLGSYPLSLRDVNRTTPKPGEMLLDYNKCDLYFLNKITGELVSVSGDIERRINDLKMRRTNIVTYDNTDPPSPVIDTTLILDNATVSGKKIRLDNDDAYTVYHDPLELYTLALSESSHIQPPLKDRTFNTIYFIINKSSE